jgi:DNA-directed RNA polymerase subunit RPC12/RpoP
MLDWLHCGQVCRPFQGLNMDREKPTAYCPICLVQILMMDHPDDKNRLAAFREKWKSVGKFRQTEGVCARCGQFGQVSHPAPMERPRL